MLSTLNKKSALFATVAALSTVQAGKSSLGTVATASNSMRMLQEVLYPADVLTCSGEKVLTTKVALSFSEYEALTAEIIVLYDAIAEGLADDGSNPRAAFSGCLVRFAGNDFMDFRFQEDGSSLGGSDACVNFSDPVNSGLEACLKSSGIAAVYDKYCDFLSLADFMVIAAEAVMGRMATWYDSENPFAEGSLAKEFRDAFKFGRTTVETCDQNTGLIPDSDVVCASLDSIFKDHIYKD